MSLEDFHLMDDSTIDTSTIKPELIEMDHQLGQQFIDSNQGVDFFFGENNNSHETANG